MPVSLYGDGTFLQKMPKVKTVGQLKKLLATLPDDLPINGVTGVKPRWFNVGRVGGSCNGEHLYFDEHDLSNW